MRAARRGGAAGAEDGVPDSPDLDAAARATLDEAADAPMDLPPG